MKTLKNPPLPWEQVASKFPKERPVLPEAYRKIYNEHYANNRSGKTKITFFSSKVEGWMHKQVAKDAIKNEDLVTLEIGAGTLNQLSFEKTKYYDIVEPFSLLYQTSDHFSRVRNVYADIGEIVCGGASLIKIGHKFTRSRAYSLCSAAEFLYIY